MADLTTEDLWDEIIELKKKLSKQTKLKKKYHEKVKLADRVITALEHDSNMFTILKGNWLGIHFIPEYFGFDETVRKDETGTTRIYIKNRVAMTKLPNNKWMIAKTVQDAEGNESVQRAEFEIHNKFEGYHVLKAYGVEVDME